MNAGKPRFNTSKAILTAGTLPLLAVQQRSWWAEASIRSFISYEQLTNSHPSLDELIADMQPFEAHNLLFMASKIGLTLHRDGGTSSDDFQVTLAGDFLPPRDSKICKRNS